MVYQDLLVIAIFILLYSLFSVRIEKTAINGPFLAVLCGLITGPALLNIFDIKIESEGYKIVAELALALVLFTDASNTNLKVVQKNIQFPTRLLLIGLPLTIIFGMIAGLLIFKGFSWIEVGILGTMLAPTDAALGKAVVSNPKVPIKVREALNVESGLNDGICVPVLFLLIALFESKTGNHVDLAFGFGLFAKQIGIGLIVGLGLTFIADRLSSFASKKGLISESWKTIVIIAISFSCFTLAQISGGSGFIACFSGGLLYGAFHKKHKPELLGAAEGAGDTMSMVTWLIFGGLVIRAFAPQFTWQVFLYSILSLTVVRMVPVALVLMGTKSSLKDVLFMGWFGPRGLASIVFAIIILEVELPHQDIIVLTAVCTILLSIVFHGLTANPFIKLISKTKT